MTFLGVEKDENFGKTLISYQDLDHTKKARVICVSDTHNRHRDLPIQEGDLFIHAGDITQRGTLPELQDFNEWLATLPHKHKIVIGGNHDEILLSSFPRFCVQRHNRTAILFRYFLAHISCPQKCRQ